MLVLVAVLAATEARPEGQVLPLPPSDQQAITVHLGAGVVGAALPADRILDAPAYFPLEDRTHVFRVTSGANAGRTQELSLARARRPTGAPAWRFHLSPTIAGFIKLTAGGDLIMPAVTDSSQGVVVVTTPANPFVLTGLRPGESRSFAQSVAVNYLDDPTRRDYSGRVTTTYTYVGAYQVMVPAGTFAAIHTRLHYRGKVGPARVEYTARYFFARGVGLVALVDQEDVAAFWVFHIDTTTGKVLDAR